MVDLGTYAVWVLSAYGVSLTLLAGITLLSILQARRVKDSLRRMEEARAKASAEVSDGQEEVGHG